MKIRLFQFRSLPIFIAVFASVLKPALAPLPLLWAQSDEVAESAEVSNSVDPESPNEKIENRPEISKAVERGLQFFRRKLDAGMIPGDGVYKNDVAITALVGMAFLSAGSSPIEGEDSVQTTRCLNFIMKNVRKNGVIAQPSATSQGAVYAHGFATTFLAECLGMTEEDLQIRRVLETAVVRIVESQGENGGWRYSFQPGEEDVSVTACMLTALRAARNAGIRVPAETIERGVQYILRCQNPDGGFRYRLVDGPSAYPRSAAAVAGLCAAGTYESSEISRALNYIQLFGQNSNSASNSESTSDGYYFYAQYYAVQAFRLTESENFSEQESNREFASGIPSKNLSENLTENPSGIQSENPSEPPSEKRFDAWFSRTANELVRKQKPDGSWNSSISVDYATAMALIVLQVENNYLPIFQQ